MSRFQGGGGTTPPLNTVLSPYFEDLRGAWREQDLLIEMFFEQAGPSVLEAPIRYVNNQGKEYLEDGSVAAAHFFNHQTHHRGQIHVLLSMSGAKSPSLDLHRITNP